MFLRHDFLNRKASGFTLVETMVGIAIMTVVVLGVLQILGMQLKVSNTARIDADVSNTVFLINALLKNSNACKENIVNFGSKKVSLPVNANEKLSVASLDYPMGGGKLVTVGGGSSSKSATLKDMNLSGFKLLSNTGGFNIISSELNLQFEKPQAVGAQVTNRKVAVQLRTDTSGNILDCSGEGTELTEFQMQAVCKTIKGASYNFGTKECQLPPPPPPQTIVMQMPVPVPVAASGTLGGQGSGNSSNGGGGGANGSNGANGSSSGASGGSSSSSSTGTSIVAVGGGGGGGAAGTRILYFENNAPEGAACMRAGSNTCQGKLTTQATCGFAYGCSNNPNESNNGHSLCTSLGGNYTETGYWTWECRGIPNRDSGIRGNQ